MAGLDLNESRSVRKAAEDAESQRIKRRAVLDSANDYIAFIVAKSVGFGAASFGGFALIAPDIAPLALANPSALLSGGIAVLAGPKLLKILYDGIGKND